MRLQLASLISGQIVKIDERPRVLMKGVNRLKPVLGGPKSHTKIEAESYSTGSGPTGILGGDLTYRSRRQDIGVLMGTQP